MQRQRVRRVEEREAAALARSSVVTVGMGNERDRVVAEPVKSVQVEMATVRARDLVQAKVTAESAVERAEGETEARRRAANAELYSEEKRAQATRLRMEAQALGVERLMEATQGSALLVQFLLAHHSGLYVDLAKETTVAARDKSSVHVWNTGGTGEAAQELFGFVEQLKATLIPPTSSSHRVSLLAEEKGTRKAVLLVSTRSQGPVLPTPTSSSNCPMWETYEVGWERWRSHA